jgi:anaphase-promoting complex subunit 6
MPVMSTPPNPTSTTQSQPLFTPLASTSRRSRPLPSRSSLSNSFSLAPSPRPHDFIDDSVDADPSVSFAYIRQGRARNAIPSGFLGASSLHHAADQGNRGMAQVSPRVRPDARRTSTGSRAGTAMGNYAATPVRNGGRMEPPRPKSRLAETSHDLEDDDEMTGEEEEERSWNMVDSMRLWRHDAIMQHLYETAAFWGDKILSWTGRST